MKDLRSVSHNYKFNRGFACCFVYFDRDTFNRLDSFDGQNLCSYSVFKERGACRRQLTYQRRSTASYRLNNELFYKEAI